MTRACTSGETAPHSAFQAKASETIFFSISPVASMYGTDKLLLCLCKLDKHNPQSFGDDNLPSVTLH